jgi:ATP-binding cassette subfamily C protein CydD
LHGDRRLLRELGRERGWLALSVGCGVLAGGTLVGQSVVLAAIVSAVFVESAGLGGLWPALGLLAAAMLVRAGLTWGSEASGAQLASRVKTSLRGRALAATLTSGASLAQRERSGELAASLTDGVEALDAYFAQYVPQQALAVAVPLTVGAFVLAHDLLSGALLLLTAPLIPLFMALIGRAAERISQRQWSEMRRLSAAFLDLLGALPTLRVLGTASRQVGRIEAVTERFRDATLRVLRVAFLSGLALELIATLSVAVVAVQVGLRLLSGGLAFEQAFVVLLLAPEFYQPLRQLGARAHAGLGAVHAADRLYALLEAAPAAGDARDRTAARQPMPARPRLRLEGIRVDYASEHGGRVRALDDVSLEIAPGEQVALVGPSGSGKTTLARVLLRFVAPSEGRLLADGIDAREIAADSWRRRIAFVPQQPHLFHESIADNIRLAHPGASDAEVEQAARAARIDGFVASLPNGYETLVGEQGARLSGGQAQRIAVARAFLKDADLVILDESSAHLDVRLETELREATSRLLEGRSALIIAHRLGTARTADRIVVLEAGRLAEQGTHDQLLRREGAYAALVGAREGRP